MSAFHHLSLYFNHPSAAAWLKRTLIIASQKRDTAMSSLTALRERSTDDFSIETIRAEWRNQQGAQRKKTAAERRSDAAALRKHFGLLFLELDSVKQLM